MTEDSVAVIVERIKGVKDGQEIIVKQFNEAQSRAEAWRERFDEKLSNRPCEKHSGFFKAIDLQLKAIWAFIGAIIIALITEHIQK